LRLTILRNPRSASRPQYSQNPLFPHLWGLSRENSMRFPKPFPPLPILLGTRCGRKTSYVSHGPLPSKSNTRRRELSLLLAGITNMHAPPGQSSPKMMILNKVHPSFSLYYINLNPPAQNPHRPGCFPESRHSLASARAIPSNIYIYIYRFRKFLSVKDNYIVLLAAHSFGFKYPLTMARNTWPALRALLLITVASIPR
jgi:hypothetical protein